MLCSTLAKIRHLLWNFISFFSFVFCPPPPPSLSPSGQPLIAQVVYLEVQLESKQWSGQWMESVAFCAFCRFVTERGRERERLQEVFLLGTVLGKHWLPPGELPQNDTLLYESFLRCCNISLTISCSFRAWDWEQYLNVCSFFFSHICPLPVLSHSHNLTHNAPLKEEPEERRIISELQSNPPLCEYTPLQHRVMKWDGIKPSIQRQWENGNSCCSYCLLSHCQIFCVQ